jgi:hypothetical protein
MAPAGHGVTGEARRGPHRGPRPQVAIGPYIFGNLYAWGRTSRWFVDAAGKPRCGATKPGRLNHFALPHSGIMRRTWRDR